jgi:hypothetical protein
VRILSLFFVPALALTYFAGTQYPHHWSFVLLGAAGAFLYLLIAQFYKLALDAPLDRVGFSASQVTVEALGNFLVFEDSVDTAEMPVYVETKQGMVPATGLYTARYFGMRVLFVDTDPTVRTHGEDS